MVELVYTWLFYLDIKKNKFIYSFHPIIEGFKSDNLKFFD